MFYWNNLWFFFKFVWILGWYCCFKDVKVEINLFLWFVGGIFVYVFFLGIFVIFGDIYFDDDEKWIMGIFEGMNLEIVVVYEFGYVLGFSYLSILEVLMVLYY